MDKVSVVEAINRSQSIVTELRIEMHELFNALARVGKAGDDEAALASTFPRPPPSPRSNPRVPLALLILIL